MRNALMLSQPFLDERLKSFVLLRAAGADVLPPFPTRRQQSKVPPLESAMAEWTLLIWALLCLLQGPEC